MPIHISWTMSHGKFSDFNKIINLDEALATVSGKIRHFGNRTGFVAYH